MKMTFTLFGILVVLLSVGPLMAANYYVDASAASSGDGTSWGTAFTDIQAAVDAAASAGGGEVWVAAGTYTATSDPVVAMKAGVHIYGGFAGTETSRGGRDWENNVTTIDGENTRRCVVGANSATLDGFTLWQGHSSYNNGGGMYNNAVSPTVANCTFLANSVEESDGGGMYNNGASPAVTNCTFQDNTVTGVEGLYGGGMCNASSSSPTVSGCTFVGNSMTGGYGGGIGNKYSSPTITGCMFQDNTTTAGYGGAIACYGGAAVVEKCTFNGNTADYYGGGISNSQSAATTVTNCVFTGNACQVNGGGIGNETNSTPVIMNCSFTKNSADHGAAISNRTSATVTVTNSIMWGNYGQFTGDKEIYTSGATCTVTYSDVDQDFSEIGNILQNPLFRDGVDGGNGYDLRLLGSSPCRDAGTFSGAPTDDILGVARPEGPGIDMGAYEYVIPAALSVYHVLPGGTGTQDGSSWENAMGDIQSAVDAASVAGAEVWVAAGTYTAGADPVVSMAENVHLYGGFAGTETSLDQRDWEANATIIDGEYSRCCVFGADNATLDGFTLWQGEGGNNTTAGGGGMFNDAVSPTVENCTFLSNRIDTSNNSGGGGGMYNRDASPTVINCTFRDNHLDGEDQYGGGICNELSSSPTITGCTFVNNSCALGGGGAIACLGTSSGIVEKCTFSGNTVDLYGGAFHIASGGTLTVTNCVFTGNIAELQGGAFWISNGTPSITNCSFADNSAPNGAAIYTNNSMAFTVTNIIAWGNTGEVIYDYHSSCAITYSCIEGGWAGYGNIDADPLFVDGTDGGNGYNLSLQAASPCIDTGTSSGAPADDILGVARPQGDGYDMGAYECEGGGSGGNTPPVADNGSYSTKENTLVAITLTGQDADGDSLTFEVTSGPSHGTLSGTSPNLMYTPYNGYTGSDSFKFVANDGLVDSVEATVSITVTLDTPPVADDGNYSTAQNTSFAIELTGSDADGDNLTFSVTSGPSHGTLFGTAPNLTYTPADGYAGPDSFKFVANDGLVDSVEATVSITVTSVNNPPEIITIITNTVAPVSVGTEISAGAPFGDDDPSTCTGTWLWGDGLTSIGHLSSVILNGQEYPAIEGIHTYFDAGVYTVQLTVTDTGGESDIAICDEYVVAYDPSAGFVTGGGWIWSPIGPYEYMDVEGKATFGFVSKYKKGATTPSGNTEFQFKAGDLNFHSTSYDWLVVTGADNAQFKGTGDIDGFGSCKFMLWAGDGPDTFRIKLWIEDESGNETVVYDNGFDQEISGGSIVVHKK